MSVNLRDPKALSSVQPDAISTYLQAHGWQFVTQWEDKATTWEIETSSDQYNLFVPVTIAFADYALRIADILNTLVEVEERPKDDIYNEILSTETREDVLRVRAKHPDAADGSIPLGDAVKLYQGAYKMLEAAASVVDYKRSYLPSYKPLEAKRFLENARAGQSELGSYVVVIHSPLDIETTNETPQENTLREEDAFGRRVMTTLSEALTSLKNIASELDTDRAGETEVEEKAESFVQKGGTAQLCEAIEELNQSVQEQEIELNFTWSQAMPLPEAILSVITIDQSIIPVTKRFRRTLRRRQQTEVVTIKGRVIRFNDRESLGDSQVVATVTLKADVNGRIRNVRIPLRSDSDRAKVIRALDQRKHISCTGQFIEYSRHNVLQNYRDLQIAED